MNEESTQRGITLHAYLQLPALTFLFYDHLLTLPAEISLIWGPIYTHHRRPTRGAAWFIANRYIGLFGNLAVLVFSYFRLSDKSCEAYSHFREALIVVNQAIIAFLLTLRIHALYSQERLVKYGIRVLVVVMSAILIWALTRQSHDTPVVVAGCNIAASSHDSHYVSVTWILLLSYDTLILILTCYKSLESLRRTTRIHRGLVELIWRDGSIYYMIMATTNAANISTFFVLDPFNRGGLSSFATCTSITVMSRIMLNLHAFAEEGIGTTQSHSLVDRDYDDKGEAVNGDEGQYELQQSGVEGDGPMFTSYFNDIEQSCD